MVRKKKVAFKEETEHLGLSQESVEWPTAEEDADEEKLSRECVILDEDSEKSSDDQDSLCMILAEDEKMRHCDRELQTDPSSGTYNLDQQEVRRGEELEEIAVSKKRSERYRSTQMSEQTWCQMMNEMSWGG